MLLHINRDLTAFSCKCRYFCPSCHAKRLALWGLWLEETLLADVPGSCPFLGR